MEQIALAVVNVLLGGVIVRLIDFRLTREKGRIDDAIALRKELWEEVHENRDAIASLNKEVDMWKDRYFQLERKYNECISKVDKLQEGYEKRR